MLSSSRFIWLSFPNYFFFLRFVYVSLCVYGMYGCLQGPEEGVGYPWTGGTYGCEPPEMGAWHWICVLWKSIKFLNSWAFSSASTSRGWARPHFFRPNQLSSISYETFFNGRDSAFLTSMHAKMCARALGHVLLGRSVSTGFVRPPSRPHRSMFVVSRCKSPVCSLS